MVLIPVGVLIHDTPGLHLGNAPWWSYAAASMAILLLRVVWCLLCESGWLPTEWGPWGWNTIWDISTEDASAMGTCPSFWLDNCCIDQTSDAAKQNGISNMKHYLANSNRLLILFTPDYLNRLWCVYELATYCKLHHTGADSNEGKQAQLVFLGLSWPSYLSASRLLRIGHRHVQLSVEERNKLASFACREARCYRPADRALVLSSIREQWGSEKNFDQFVRCVLPVVMEKGKQRYAGQSQKASSRAWNMLFG